MLGLALCKRDTAKPNLENAPSVRAEAKSLTKASGVLMSNDPTDNANE
jgi:hypothetical protein